MKAFNFPGQEHLPKSTLTAVATGTHTGAAAVKPAPSAQDRKDEQQRRIISIQLAQKTLSETATIDTLLKAARDIERFITTGAAVEDVVAHGATAVRLA